jgi:hypothetical protein
MEELKVYVVSGYTKSQLADEHDKGLLGKIPTLHEAVSAVQKELAEVGVSEWSATLELDVEIGTGVILPGGKTSIKTTVNIKGKPTSTP